MGKAGPKEWKEILAEMGYLKAVPSVPSLADALDLEMSGEELADFWGTYWLKQGEGQKTRRNPPCS